MFGQHFISQMLIVINEIHNIKSSNYSILFQPDIKVQASTGTIDEFSAASLSCIVTGNGKLVEITNSAIQARVELEVFLTGKFD